MDYINNIVFISKYIPENVYEIEKGGLFGWLETKSSRRNDDDDDDENKRVRICNFFFVVKSIEYVIDASGNKTQYINVSIRRIFWDKDILSYDDPLDYKLTSNDIRSNAVFLRKIDVLFQIKSKQLFFDLLNAMIQLAEKTTTYVIKKTGWQDNGSYAFGNGVICQTNSDNFV